MWKKFGSLACLVLIGIFLATGLEGAATQKGAMKTAAVDTALVFGKAGNGPGAFRTIDGV